ncbi:MAG: efflux RND transporter periplasmic adaptor subunit, partial [Myxococcales bacterium]|nr:efflux RND transporter periplasmic adaptor subunit [Myxococcales bacterium]
QVVMQPELNGRVTWMNEELLPGGRLAEGDTLVRIDARDYQAALEQQRAQVASSQLNVSTEESRRVIAEREWALLERERNAASESGRQLALREPQTQAAEASLRAARSGLRQAQTNLSRTSLRAPFDSIVISENVDVGQLVGPATQLATLVGTDHFWVRVSIPMEQLRHVTLPSEGTPGSTATVTQHVGESDAIVRSGRVIRLLGDLDPVGRMARVLVEIENPLGAEGDLPMLLGATVDVEIEAGTLEGVYRIPRAALHAENQVHLFGGGSLALQDVDVVWRDDESVLVRGLTSGDELVLSTVSPPIEGTRLRRAEPEPETTASAEEPASP